MQPRPLRVLCRPIVDADLEAILNLLRKSGFGGTREFWVEALRRLSEHEPPQGLPKYGYLLEVNGIAVGMLLLISATVPGVDGPKIRCNVSCWFVWPAFQVYGTLLVAQALKHREATYFNISPLKHTLEILAAQGHSRYCEGRLTCVPALSLHWPKVCVADVTDATKPDDSIPADEIDLLLEHAHYGCLSLIVTHDGNRHPFVFEPTRKFCYIRVAYLTYCRSIADFVRFAGPLGRYLARRGFLFADLDANGPIGGLVGKYWKTTPKYYRGPDRPRLGDLAYSERVVLGLQFPSRIGPQE